MAMITANENPELNLEMEAMDRNTPAHFSEWNTRHQQLLDNDSNLNQQLAALGLEVVDGCLCTVYDDEQEG
jgi:hypothetical protein